jgi:phosphate transport system substrate-binding protein
MKNYFTILVFVALSFLVIRCDKKNVEKPVDETILKGTTTILVDETLKPIVEDQVQIFESKYKAKINIDPKSEAEVVQSLVMDSSKIAILSRVLTKEEEKVFANKKLVPKITPFAKDAIALIANKNNKDTLIALQDIISFIQEKDQSRIKGLVFDNPNSSTARYICELAGVSSLPKTGVFSFKTNNDVIKHVAENDGLIGIIGVNFLSDPTPEMKQYITKLNVLELRGTKSDKYYGPTQNNIAEGNYPLARDLYIINCQGYSGLGMGFASFIAGDIGQRIVLKSGLVPVRVPGRKFDVRNKIEKDKNK